VVSLSQCASRVGLVCAYGSHELEARSSTGFRIVRDGMDPEGLAFALLYVQDGFVAVLFRRLGPRDGTSVDRRFEIPDHALCPWKLLGYG
jgi:hypothetical protein